MSGDDGGDDAAILGPDAGALPRGRWHNSRDAPRLADRARWHQLLLRLDDVRNNRLSRGVALAEVEMQRPAVARAVPIAVGVVVLIAGALQRSAWKMRHLACCLESPGRGGTLPADASTAWRHGLRLGIHCTCCSGGLMAILLVTGVMNLGAMVIVAAAITLERLAPTGERVARVIGAVVVGTGVFLVTRAW
jgi:predicted metal-binding membrane protein